MKNISFFYLLFFVLLALGSWYIWAKFVALSPLHHRKTAKKVWAIVLVLYWLLVTGARLAFNSMPDEVPGAVFWWSYALLGIWAICIIGFALFDLLRLPFWWRKERSEKKSFFIPERRDFFSKLKDVAVLSYATGTSAAGSSDFFLKPKVKEVEIQLPPQHSYLKGFRLVQLSDIHIGPILQRDFAQLLVDKVNPLQADLIAITGDLMDGSPEKLVPEMQPFHHFKAKHGVVFCPGNHEIYSGLKRWLDVIPTFGWRVLANQHELISVGEGQLVVGGVHDLSVNRHHPELVSDPKQAFAGAPENGYRLLMAHQPRSCFAADEAGTDLQISGHTHAGQFFPWSLVVYLAHPYVVGLHQHSERMKIYVNAGTGWWGPPNRFAVPGEITLFKFV